MVRSATLEARRRGFFLASWLRSRGIGGIGGIGKALLAASARMGLSADEGSVDNKLATAGAPKSTNLRGESCPDGSRLRQLLGPSVW